MTSTALLEGRNLQKYFARPQSMFFGRRQAPVRAVEDISLTLGKQETLAIVGESGCGKSTTARMLLALEKPTAGAVWFDGFSLATATRVQLRRYRSGVQAVFQDPWSSLNPRMRINEIIAEPLIINGHAREAIDIAVAQSLHDVGLEPAAGRNFPHEFSGGQRQRIAIARAVALRPLAIVLDEPVSALDVSVRAQIMNLLKDLQISLGMSYVLISHDLATVRFLANRVAVMYRGRIVEQAQSEALFLAPRHPYTETLIAAARLRRSENSRRVKVAIPISALNHRANSSQGCPFASRCTKVFGRCLTEAPALKKWEGSHEAACHLY